MFNNTLFNSAGILSNMIEKEPGAIMGPINTFLGYILNFFFDIIHYLTEPNSLGITIILFTILIRCLMIPSGIKTQKSMFMLKKLQPEVEKIKAKYAGSKDAETQRKISAETQALYAKHNYNPFSGCLPLFITMPIFFALSYLLRQPFMFIDRFGDIYGLLAMEIMKAPNYKEVITPIAEKYITGDITINISYVYDLMKALNKFTPEDWDVILNTLASPASAGVAAVLEQKVNYETFLGLSLLNVSGFGFPGILIPVLSAASQFLPTFYGYKTNPPTDPSQKSMQMMMMIVMPPFMGYITAGFSVGVGIYWITGNIFMFIQQVLVTRYLRKKEVS